VLCVVLCRGRGVWAGEREGNKQGRSVEGGEERRLAQGEQTRGRMRARATSFPPRCAHEMHEAHTSNTNTRKEKKTHVERQLRRVQHDGRALVGLGGAADGPRGGAHGRVEDAPDGAEHLARGVPLGLLDARVPVFWLFGLFGRFGFAVVSVGRRASAACWFFALFALASKKNVSPEPSAGDPVLGGDRMRDSRRGKHAVPCGGTRTRAHAGES
jgi:hypothetical protein